MKQTIRLFVAALAVTLPFVLDRELHLVLGPDESLNQPVGPIDRQAMLDAGIFVGGKPLDAPETATTVRLRESKREIQDGPYSNTKEQLGGFTLLELPSLDAALEWAARCPAASYGTVEVRPIAVELEPRVTVANSN